MKKSIILSLLLMSVITLHAQRADYSVVPMPQQIHLTGKSMFRLSASTRIVYPEADEEMERNARFLQDYVREITGIRPVLSTNVLQSRGDVIRLVIGGDIKHDEGYTLSVSQKGVAIKGRTAAGVFYGIQTFRKAMPVGKTAFVGLPAVEIIDAPRFTYRGMMLDCGRHFFPVKFIKEVIDLMAMHNMNRFHWHLTEDQGWRIEIKKYPLLTAVGSNRPETVIGRNSSVGDGTPYGGYYTQDEAREIVEYARQRHVVVVPEIDMPGHQLAALASIPTLGCTGGGDEAPTIRMTNCEKCQKLMQREHLTPKTIQGYFTNRIEKFINSKGRRIMGWDEILGGNIHQSATIHCWRDPVYGIRAAQKGHDVIMSPSKYCYFNRNQANPKTSNEPFSNDLYLPLDSVYNMVIVPNDISFENRKHIIGVEACLWTEYIAVPNHAEYMMLPRMAALAENAWCLQKGSYSAFIPRLSRLKSLYDACHLHYGKHCWEK